MWVMSGSLRRLARARCDDRIGGRSGRCSASSTVSLNWRADAAAKPGQTRQGTLLTQLSQREGPSPVIQIYKEMQQTYIFHAGGYKYAPINKGSKILCGGAQSDMRHEWWVSSPPMGEKQVVGIFWDTIPFHCHNAKTIWFGILE